MGPRAVIVIVGFGGLAAARALAGAPLLDPVVRAGLSPLELAR